MTQQAPDRFEGANDNEPARQKEGRRVTVLWPDKIPVTCSELDLLELYLSDLIAMVADNDN